MLLAMEILFKVFLGFILLAVVGGIIDQKVRSLLLRRKMDQETEQKELETFLVACR